MNYFGCSLTGRTLVSLLCRNTLWTKAEGIILRKLENFVVLQRCWLTIVMIYTLNIDAYLRTETSEGTKWNLLESFWNIQLYQMMQELGGQTSFSIVNVSLKQNPTSTGFVFREGIWQKMSSNMKVSFYLPLIMLHKLLKEITCKIVLFSGFWSWILGRCCSTLSNPFGSFLLLRPQSLHS